MTTPKRKYTKHAQSMQSFITPLPTDRLLWLIKLAADEITQRELESDLGRKRGPRPMEFKLRDLQPQGRTLR